MVGMRCYFQWQSSVIDEIVKLDEAKPHRSKLLCYFAADALDGMPIVGAQRPIDIHLGHTQLVLLVQ
ncbi:hypothetical protein D3C77_752770 [compost metagenome]